MYSTLWLMGLLKQVIIGGHHLVPVWMNQPQWIKWRSTAKLR